MSNMLELVRVCQVRTVPGEQEVAPVNARLHHVLAPVRVHRGTVTRPSASTRFPWVPVTRGSGIRARLREKRQRQMQGPKATERHGYASRIAATSSAETRDGRRKRASILRSRACGLMARRRRGRLQTPWQAGHLEALAAQAEGKAEHADAADGEGGCGCGLGAEELDQGSGAGSERVRGVSAAACMKQAWHAGRAGRRRVSGKSTPRLRGRAARSRGCTGHVCNPLPANTFGSWHVYCACSFTHPLVRADGECPATTIRGSPLHGG
jgi:hypothetical protein